MKKCAKDKCPSKTKYPAYNRFPFISDEAQLQEFNDKYADLIRWQKEIYDDLTDKTLNEIIDDYSEEGNSDNKREEQKLNIHSFVCFYHCVFCPRFAINFCVELEKKWASRSTGLPSEVESLLVDYDTYKKKQNSDKSKLSTDNLLKPKNRVIKDAIAIFGVPSSPTFTNLLHNRHYWYDKKSNILVKKNDKDEVTICSLRLLNELFLDQKKPIKISRIYKNSKVIGVKIMGIDKNNIETIACLLIWTFSKDIHNISNGNDYIRFDFNDNSPICGKDNQNVPFIYLAISAISKKKKNLRDVRAIYKDYKRSIIQPKP